MSLRTCDAEGERRCAAANVAAGWSRRSTPFTDGRAGMSPRTSGGKEGTLRPRDGRGGRRTTRTATGVTSPKTSDREGTTRPATADEVAGWLRLLMPHTDGRGGVFPRTSGSEGRVDLAAGRPQRSVHRLDGRGGDIAAEKRWGAASRGKRSPLPRTRPQDGRGDRHPAWMAAGVCRCNE